NLYRAKIFCTKDASYLFLEVHHIAADGESLAIILHDISESYAGKPLETEVFTGYEIALEEETARETKQLKDAEDYYSSVFGGCDPNCFIPKSADECEILGTYGCLEMESSTNLTAVKKVCEKINVSMNAFYLSAFGYLLAKYLYREDSVFTTIYNGRSDSRMANTVDMLVKTLPVYVNIEKNDDVAELCRITQSQFMDSMANDLYSFAEISQKFGIKADIQFIFQGDLFNFDSLCGKPAERIPLQLNAAKTPLDIKVFIIDDKISYKVEYKADFYEETFVRHILKSLDMAVKGFSEKQKLSDISLVSEESLKVYDALNDNNVDFNVVSVNKLFENQVRKNPERTAVIVNEESLTYGELNKFANRIAHALIKRGVHKDSIVGMVFDRTKEIFIAEHGILKSGAAFLPMVEEYPDDRISFCLHDAASPFVLTTEKIKAERATLFEEAKPCQVLTIEELIQEGADGSCDKNPDLEIPVDSLAYCIYTSGSTGRPKGVMLEHRNMCNYVTFNEKNISHYSLVNGIKTSLSVTSIAFDMSITERYISLCNGITLVMATLDEIHNPLQLNQLMLKHKVETIVCTPSFLSSLYDFEELHTSLKNLKAGHIGGENLPDTLVKKIKTLNPEFHLINGYGPTETSVAPTASESEIGHRVMIGRPGPNVKCFVVDKKLNLLPPGMQGELLICGKGVGRGYVNLPEKTKVAFIEYKGCKAYHSGDKVRITSKGILECFGRLDNQVKLRGLRIELDEIENVISSYNKIRLVKVIVRNNGTEDYLAGFFTADTHIDINELKNYLAAKLTPYMIPDALMQLDEMPLNSNGKIDKKALPETTVQFDEAEYVEPANDLEKFFCEVFEKVLKREKIGATENFFKI
ncbi:MAG: amino acid adenylation domain-containing protein, partial [Treponema sp.]|nr:amino acid adenylation domain-containing protein [Treponema sp.]